MHSDIKNTFSKLGKLISFQVVLAPRGGFRDTAPKKSRFDFNEANVVSLGWFIYLLGCQNKQCLYINKRYAVDEITS